MDFEEFKKLLSRVIDTIVDKGIKKEYFDVKKKQELDEKLKQVVDKGIKTDIEGTGIYGLYDPETKQLSYNAKMFKSEQEALIYILHEMKHVLDEHELGIGFDLNSTREGVGMNEGATQRFATDISEEILGEKIPETLQTSLGIFLSTNLDEYQIEDKINELFCLAMGITKEEFLKIQNENELKQRVNEIFDFDAFQKALDGIYSIQEETWIDENGNLLEKEAEPTPEQTERAKELIRRCQSQIRQFIEETNPEMLYQFDQRKIMIEDQPLLDDAVIHQEDYFRYQEFITKGMDLGEYDIVIVSGLENTTFDKITEEEPSLRQELENSESTREEYIYLRQKKDDAYVKIRVVFDIAGVKEIGKIENITDLGEMEYIIGETDVIGNLKSRILFKTMGIRIFYE